MRLFNLFLNHMVQKYQNEISPILYYGISTKTNEKDLKIPNLQPFDWKVLTEWHCQLYKYFQCEYLQVSPQVTLASRHLILWSSPSPHWPPPPHWPRSSEARTQCPAPSRRGTRIKLSTKFSDSFEYFEKAPTMAFSFQQVLQVYTQLLN